MVRSRWCTALSVCCWCCRWLSEWYLSTEKRRERLTPPLSPHSLTYSFFFLQGKSSVCKAILDRLNVQWVAILPTDSFYKPLTAEQKADVANYNFDHPSAFDWPLLIETLRALKRCEKVSVPHYDFVSHSRLPTSSTIYGADVIIVEGILALYHKEVRAELDMKIFVDTDSDVRLCRRLRRDIAERGRDVNGVLLQYERFVKPAFDEFVQPTMQHADIVVPRGVDNKVAIDLIASHVANKMRERAEREGALALQRLSSPAIQLESEQVPDTVTVLPPDSRHTLALVTGLRNSKTHRAKFVAFADRLIMKTFELALTKVPLVEATVTTLTGAAFHGYLPSSDEICAVSVLRSGDAMTHNLMKIVRTGCKYGQILIQADSDTLPALFYLKLPPSIAKMSVIFLCYPTMTTGESMTMAIRVLLDHGVRAERIIVVTLFATLLSLHVIKNAFPSVEVVAAAVENHVSEHGFLQVGAFSDRYYGTHESEADNREHLLN
jgi:uridine kinase